MEDNKENPMLEPIKGKGMKIAIVGHGIDNTSAMIAALKKRDISIAVISPGVLTTEVSDSLKEMSKGENIIIIDSLPESLIKPISIKPTKVVKKEKMSPFIPRAVQINLAKDAKCQKRGHHIYIPYEIKEGVLTRVENICACGKKG